MSGAAVKSHDWPNMGRVLKDRQFRTSCLSRVICQFWRQFVFYIAVTGIVEKKTDQASGNRAASSSSSGSVFERSDEQATRRLVQESQRDDKKDAGDPLADLRYWLEDFKDNLGDVKMLAPHTSLDTHFLKDRHCDVCLRTHELFVNSLEFRKSCE